MISSAVRITGARWLSGDVTVKGTTPYIRIGRSFFVTPWGWRSVIYMYALGCISAVTSRRRVVCPSVQSYSLTESSLVPFSMLTMARLPFADGKVTVIFSPGA